MSAACTGSRGTGVQKLQILLCYRAWQILPFLARFLSPISGSFPWFFCFRISLEANFGPNEEFFPNKRT